MSDIRLAYYGGTPAEGYTQARWDASYGQLLGIVRFYYLTNEQYASGVEWELPENEIFYGDYFSIYGHFYITMPSTCKIGRYSKTNPLHKKVNISLFAMFNNKSVTGGVFDTIDVKNTDKLYLNLSTLAYNMGTNLPNGVNTEGGQLLLSIGASFDGFSCNPIIPAPFPDYVDPDAEDLEPDPRQKVTINFEGVNNNFNTFFYATDLPTKTLNIDDPLVINPVLGSSYKLEFRPKRGYEILNIDGAHSTVSGTIHTVEIDSLFSEEEEKVYNVVISSRLIPSPKYIFKSHGSDMPVSDWLTEIEQLDITLTPSQIESGSVSIREMGAMNKVPLDVVVESDHKVFGIGLEGSYPTIDASWLKVENDPDNLVKIVTIVAAYNVYFLAFAITGSYPDEGHVITLSVEKPEKGVDSNNPSNQVFLLNSQQVLDFSSTGLFEYGTGGTDSSHITGLQDFILGFVWIPYQVPDDFLGVETPITVGGYLTNGSGLRVLNDLVEIDLGVISMPDAKNSIDLIESKCILKIPYSDAEIELNPSDIFNNSINIKVIVEVYTGKGTVNIYKNDKLLPFQSENISIGRNIPISFSSARVSDSTINTTFSKINRATIEVLTPELLSENSSYVYIDGTLGDFKGLVSGEDVRLDIPTSSGEILEIRRLLADGVFINE